MKLVLLSAFVLALVTPEVAIAKDLKLNGGGWDYITYADDGTQYFGKIQTKLGDQRVLKVRFVDDPDSKNKDYVNTFGVNCTTRLYKPAGSDWIKANAQTVAEAWVKYACD